MANEYIVKVLSVILLSYLSILNVFSMECSISQVTKEIYEIVKAFDNGNLSRKKCSEIIDCDIDTAEVIKHNINKKEENFTIMEFSLKKFNLIFIYKSEYEKEEDLNPDVIIVTFENQIKGIPVADLVKEFGEWEFLTKRTKETLMSFKFKGDEVQEKDSYTKIRCQNIFGSKEVMNCLVKTIRIETFRSPSIER